MLYRIELSPASVRTLRELPKDARRRVARKIEGLTENPRPPDSKKLTDESDLYRVRTGDHRIIYSVEDERVVVLVVRIGHRRDIYKKPR